MAFRTAKTRTKDARALRNPKPSFVSLVKAGANQTPLRSVKADQLTIQETEAMTTINALRADGHEVARVLITKGDRFPNEDAAKAWLEEGGYPLDTIKVTDEAFELTNGDDQFEDDVKAIKLDDEVTVFVGKLQSDPAEEVDPEVAAAKKANKAGSAITAVEKATGAKKGGTEDGDGAEAQGEDGEGSTKAGEDGGGTYDKTIHGIDGKSKQVKVRTRTRTAKSSRQIKRDGEDAEAVAKDGDDAAAEDETADKNIPKKGRRRTVVVGDQEFEFEVMTDEAAKELQIPEGSFEVSAEKVELLGGDCGPGHTMLNVGGRTVCVPTGDVSGIAQEEEVTSVPDPAGGQSGAGFGAVSPAAGQVQRREGAASIDHDGSPDMSKKFDDFAAHFSGGSTVGEVMADANDGIPPGFESVIFAMVTAMRNNFLEGDTDAVKAVGVEFGEIASQLGELFGTNVERTARKASIDAVSGIFAEIGWSADGEGDGSIAAPSATQETLTKMAEAITGLANTVKAGLSQVTEQVAETAQRVEALEDSDLTDRVSKVEDQTNKQTRKGVDVGDLADSRPNDVKKSEERTAFAKRNLRSQLGSVNTRG